MRKKTSKDGTYIISVTEYKGGNKLVIKEKEKASENSKMQINEGIHMEIVGGVTHIDVNNNEFTEVEIVGTDRIELCNVKCSKCIVEAENIVIRNINAKELISVNCATLGFGDNIVTGKMELRFTSALYVDEELSKSNTHIKTLRIGASDKYEVNEAIKDYFLVTLPEGIEHKIIDFGYLGEAKESLVIGCEGFTYNLKGLNKLLLIRLIELGITYNSEATKIKCSELEEFDIFYIAKAIAIVSQAIDERICITAGAESIALEVEKGLKYGGWNNEKIILELDENIGKAISIKVI